MVDTVLVLYYTTKTNSKRADVTRGTRTCRFVPDELAALDLADAGEERAYVVLRHVLRQVVDDEVGLALLQRALAHVLQALQRPRVVTQRRAVAATAAILL